MKSNKVKRILLQDEEKIGMKCIYDFNPDGMILSMTSIRYNNEKPDTAFYTISIQRKSDAAKAHYFEDRTLKATYSFY